MKKITSLALSAFTLMACNKDDDNRDNVSLTGTWKLTSATLAVGTDFNNDGNASTDFMAETGCLNNSFIHFADDVDSAIIEMQFVDASQNNGSYIVECVPAQRQSAQITILESTFVLTSDDYSITLSKEGNKLTSNNNSRIFVFTKQ